MSLPPTNYLIRWAPRDPPPLGGVYATSEGLGAQIAAKALGPPPLEQNVGFSLFIISSSEPSITHLT